MSLNAGTSTRHKSDKVRIPASESMDVFRGDEIMTFDQILRYVNFNKRHLTNLGTQTGLLAKRTIWGSYISYGASFVIETVSISNELSHHKMWCIPEDANLDIWMSVLFCKMAYI